MIEPLDRGFGYTFGNSLRRVLLSSLEGAAVTSVKIEGVAHEFTTLPGVREDVTDIILNLKNLICRLHGESPEIEVRLRRRAPAPVTAADIEAPADLEILNPDLEIAHLVRQGQARDDADDRPRPRLRPGRAEPRARAHDRRHPDRLDLLARAARLVRRRGRPRRSAHRLRQARASTSRPTARSTPRRRSAQAAEILIRQLAIFTDLEQIEGFGEAAAEAAAEAPSLAHGMENFPIEELELGVRSYNCLKRVGIETIGDLVIEDRERARRDPELRQEVDRGGQGDARHARPDAARARSSLAS